MNTCAGCGATLPPKTWKGRDQKWCSETCRKAATYVRHCIDCGARLNSSDGNGPSASVRCVKCAPIVSAAERKVWTPDAIVAAIREWAAEHGGEHPTTMDWGSPGSGPGRRYHPDYLAEPERWPHYQTVLREFAYPRPWARAVTAAGFTPRGRGVNVSRRRAAA